MTREQAIYGYLSTLGIPVYAEGTVPAHAEYPYLTYHYTVGGCGEAAALSLRFTDRTSSFASSDEFFRAAEQFIPSDGMIVPYSDGAVWLWRGSPFLQRECEPRDRAVRHADVKADAVFLE